MLPREAPQPFRASLSKRSPPVPAAPAPRAMSVPAASMLLRAHAAGRRLPVEQVRALQGMVGNRALASLLHRAPAPGVQRVLRVPDAEGNVRDYARRGTIARHVPPMTGNRTAVINVLHALSQAPGTHAFDDWDAAIQGAYGFIVQLMDASEIFDLDLLGRDGLGSLELAMLNAALFGFDDNAAARLLATFFGQGLWRRGNVRIDVRDAWLEGEAPYATTYFLFRSPLRLGTFTIPGIGLNTHAGIDGRAYSGSAWLVGYSDFARESNQLAVLTNVVNDLYALSMPLRDQVARIAARLRRGADEFGNRMARIRFGGSDDSKRRGGDESKGSSASTWRK